MRYPILIGQAIGQQIANAPRPQDRNTVAALASKIDAMLAQSRCFVTVQDIDLGLLFGIGLASLKCGRPWTDTAPFPLGPVTMPGITSCWASIVAARGTVHLSRVLSGSGGRRIMATALGAAGRRLGSRLAPLVPFAIVPLAGLGTMLITFVRPSMMNSLSHEKGPSRGNCLEASRHQLRRSTGRTIKPG